MRFLFFTLSYLFYLFDWCRQSQGKGKAKELNAYTYLECSAKTKKNLAAVYEEATKAKQPSGFINKFMNWS